MNSPSPEEFPDYSEFEPDELSYSEKSTLDFWYKQNVYLDAADIVMEALKNNSIDKTTLRMAHEAHAEYVESFNHVLNTLLGDDADTPNDTSVLLQEIATILHTEHTNRVAYLRALEPEDIEEDEDNPDYYLNQITKVLDPDADVHEIKDVVLEIFDNTLHRDYTNLIGTNFLDGMLTNSDDDTTTPEHSIAPTTQDHLAPATVEHIIEMPQKVIRKLGKTAFHFMSGRSVTSWMNGHFESN